MGSLALLKTGKILNLVVRQVCFHDPTSTVSLLVAEFVLVSDPIAIRLLRRLTDGVRQMLQSLVKLVKASRWASNVG